MMLPKWIGHQARALIKLIPPGILLRLCVRLASPSKLRRLPGWRLGAAESAPGVRNRLRTLLWEGFSAHDQTARFEFAWLFGIRLLAYPKVETCRALYITGDYEPNEMWHLRRMLAPGMVFIDVGANLGLYALLAATLVGSQGSVIAIEPSRREFERLSANIALNHASNVRSIRTALSDHAGEQELLVFEDEHSGHNTFGAPRYHGVRLERLERVHVEPLDDLVHALGLDRIDIVKIDVEGHEFYVLKGAAGVLKRHRPVLLIEVLDPEPEDKTSKQRTQVFEMLGEMGYLLFRYDESTALLRFAARDDAYRGNLVAVPRDSEWLKAMGRRDQFSETVGA